MPTLHLSAWGNCHDDKYVDGKMRDAEQEADKHKDIEPWGDTVATREVSGLGSEGVVKVNPARVSCATCIDQAPLVGRLESGSHAPLE